MKKLELSYTSSGMFKDTKRVISSRERMFSKNITEKGLYVEYIGNSWKSVRKKNRQHRRKMGKKIQVSNSQREYLNIWLVNLKYITNYFGNLKCKLKQQ